MSGPVRWLAFFSTIVLALAGVFALRGGITEALMKSVGSFAILALAALALYGVAGKGRKE